MFRTKKNIHSKYVLVQNVYLSDFCQIYFLVLFTISSKVTEKIDYSKQFRGKKVVKNVKKRHDMVWERDHSNIFGPFPCHSMPILEYSRTSLVFKFLLAVKLVKTLLFRSIIKFQKTFNPETGTLRKARLWNPGATVNRIR